MASNIVHAINAGEGDNQDDTVPISGGHSYSTDVYDNDPNSDSNSDSCDQSDSPDTGSSSGGEGGSIGGYGYGGGWGGGFFFGAGGCWGSCGSRGSGSVTITDLVVSSQ